MSKSDIISKLMDEISSQNDWYLTAIGILITLTLFVSGFSIYAQVNHHALKDVACEQTPF